MSKFKPSHPGLIVEDVLLSQNIRPVDLAKAMMVSPSTVSRIISGKMGISADLALRLEKTLSINAQLLVNMQASYDLFIAERADKESNFMENLPKLIKTSSLSIETA